MKTKIIFCILLLVFTNFIQTVDAYAESKPSLVLINHTNLTKYDELVIGEHIDAVMLIKMVNSNIFEIYDKQTVQEVLQAEDELTVTKEELKDAIKSNSFENVFSLTENDLSSKNVNDYINAKYTQTIGGKHNAEYILHCTLEGVSKETSNFIVPVKSKAYTQVQSNLKFVATFRLIRAKDGKIVWLARENSTAHDYQGSYDGYTYEKKSDYEKLYVACADKVTDKVIKHLKNAMGAKEIEL